MFTMISEKIKFCVEGPAICFAFTICIYLAFPLIFCVCQISIYMYMYFFIIQLQYSYVLGCTSGLLVNCLPGIERLQVRAPLSCRLFSPMSILSSTFKMRRCLSPPPLEGCKAICPGELLN